MSLMRTALRLAAVQALVADPVIAAIAGKRVYDSRLEPIAAAEPVPMILLFTEDDEGDGFSTQQGGPPFDRECQLVVEISVRQFAKAESGMTLATPATDAQIEALIDLVENRVVTVLGVGESALPVLINSQIVRRWSRIRSARYQTDDPGERIAVRIVQLSAELETDTSLGLPAVFSALRPLLGSGGQQLVDLLTAVAGTETADPSFAGMDLTLAPKALLGTLPPDRPGLIARKDVSGFTAAPDQS